MMKRWLSILMVGVVLCSIPLAAHAVKIGAPAPEFAAAASDGKTYKLADFRGKFVVLEWHNQGCPFVKKYYSASHMQKLQAEWRAKGVVWLTVISSVAGRQGHMSAAQENAYLKETGATPTAALLDGEAKVAAQYEAKTTPHMFVIDPAGKVIYNGAIDDHATADPADIANSKNYVSAALTEAMAGKAVSTPSTRPYGCGVKYR
jgi:peroxiredoxin